MPTIALEHVSKHWGATRAADDVSFTAASGGLVVLPSVGPLLLAFLLFRRRFVQSFMRAGVK